MKRWGIIPLILLNFVSLIFALNAHAFSTYQVGDVIIGHQYNAILQDWIDINFAVRVGVDGSGNEYVLFVAATALGNAVVNMELDNLLKDKLTNAVNKALEWSEVARKNNADTKKGLGCFGRKPVSAYPDAPNFCEDFSQAYEKGQMSFNFLSSNGGKQTKLIISIVDRVNEYIKANIYINPDGMQQLLSAINSIEEGLTKAKETASKQDLFK